MIGDFLPYRCEPPMNDTRPLPSVPLTTSSDPAPVLRHQEPARPAHAGRSTAPRTAGVMDRDEQRRWAYVALCARAWPLCAQVMPCVPVPAQGYCFETAAHARWNPLPGPRGLSPQAAWVAQMMERGATSAALGAVPLPVPYRSLG